MVAELALIILVVTVVVVLFFTTFGKRLRLRAKGTAEEVIVKDASTPDGAKAYYNTAIEAKEKDYQQAHTIYAQMLGKIDAYEKQLRDFKKERMQLNLDINTCIDNGDDEGAKVYLKRQAEVDEKKEIIENALKTLQDNAKLQKETVDTLFEDLGDLKSEKETSILALEVAQSTRSLQVAPGVSSREEDKMLEKVRDGIRKTTEEADGNRIAYESSATVQQKRLDQRLKEESIEQKLQELKANRNK